MLIYQGRELEDYKREALCINPKWNERDFTSGVKSYLDGRTEKILAICGLRGTGKTVGILQACTGHDIAYLLAQKDDGKNGSDYVDFLKNTQKKDIVIDEYGWIQDRESLDRYLLTSVQNGKRIVITGTESITLNFLNYGALNHRVHPLHTTMFTYEEYLRLYDARHSKATCRQYLMEGGLFREYALKSYESARAYIEEAIVQNLTGYIRNRMSEEKARTLTYCVLYKAICPSNLSTVPTLRRAHVTLTNFLESMGINITLIPENRDLNNVADIFEQIGLIVRIPNYDVNSGIREQYYITNPSLTCQLIKGAYGLPDIENSILGHVFESAVAVQLYTNKLEEHDIFFFNNGNDQQNSDNKELDLILTDKEREYAYFVECKFSQHNTISSDITLLSGYLENNIFPNTEIEGRYVVYNGKPCVKEYNVGTIIFTPIGEILDNYFAFDKYAERLKQEHPNIDGHTTEGTFTKKVPGTMNVP